MSAPRVFYTQHGSYDTHSGELLNHATLWDELSNAVGDFFADLEEHGLEDDAVVMVFSEFGRRIDDNGSGTDHGSGGVAFVMGNPTSRAAYTANTRRSNPSTKSKATWHTTTTSEACTPPC